MDAAADRWGRDRLVLANQVQNLLLALRSSGRFGSKARFLSASLASEHPLLRGLRELQRQLMQPSLTQPIGEESILQPFCAVCVSEEAGDTIIGVVLAALANLVDLRCTFITHYGLDKLIRAAHKVCGEPMETDSHELVLVRCLQLCVSCAASPCARELPERRFVEMVARAYALAVHPAATLVLQRTAEKAMKDIIFSLYAPVTNPGDSSKGPVGVEMLRFVSGLIAGSTESKGDAANGGGVSKAIAQLEGLGLAQAMLFVVQDRLDGPLLHAVQHDLSRALLVTGVVTENVIVLAQLLRTVHIVIKLASVNVVPQAFSFIKVLHIDPILRITEELRAQSSVNPRATPSPRVAMSPVMPSVPTPAPRTTAQLIDLYERREVLLESLAEICSDAHFAAFCYAHYDLSQRFSPLLDRLCGVLAANCFPVEEMDLENDGGVPGNGSCSDACLIRRMNQSDALALDAISGLLQQTTPLNDVSLDSSVMLALKVPVQTQLHEKATLMKFAALFFKDAAKEGIPFLLRTARRVPAGSLTPECDAFVLEEPVSGREVGACLFRLNDILDKRALGEYLGDLGREPPAPDEEAGSDARAAWEMERAKDHLHPGTVRFQEQQLEGFLGLFDYTNKSLLTCIRETAYRMCMPGEAQKIDRVMEAFAKRWMEANREASKDINPFCTEQGPFIIAFSLIMLNTDQHSGKMMKPMTQADFRRVHRDSDGGNSLSEAYLNDLFDDVREHPIIMAEMINAGFSNNVTWALEMHESYRSPRSKDSKASPIYSMQGVKGDANKDMAAETLRPFIFSVVWPYCIRAYANTLDRCRQCLERRVGEAPANGTSYKTRSDRDDEDESEDAQYDNNGYLDGEDDNGCAAKKANDSSREDDYEKDEEEDGDEDDENGKFFENGQQRRRHNVTPESADTAPLCSAEAAYNKALTGIALLARTAAARGFSSAVDQVLLELLEQVGMDHCDTRDAVSWLAARPHVLRALRTLVSVARDCLPAVQNAWGPLATCMARLFLLGAIPPPPPRAAGALAAVWDDVRDELRRVARGRRADNLRASPSWLSALWGAAPESAARGGPKAQRRRVRAALPSLTVLLRLLDDAAAPGPHAAAVRAVCEAAAEPSGAALGDPGGWGVRAADGLAMVLAAATIERRPGADPAAVECFAVACEQFFATAAEAMARGGAGSESPPRRAAHRVAAAAGAVAVVAAQQGAPQCAARVLSAVASAPPAARGAVAAPLADALRKAIATATARDGADCDPALLHAVLAAAPRCAAETAAAEAVSVVAAVAPDLSGGAALAAAAASALVAVGVAGAGGVLEAATRLCRRAAAGGAEWRGTWRAALGTLASLVLGARAAGDRAEALLCLQCCLLDTGASGLTPADVAALYEDVVFPLIDRMGALPPTGAAARSPSAPSPAPSIAASALAGTTLVSSLFGSFAPPPPLLVERAQQQQRQEAAAAQEGRGAAADLRCRVVTLLPKAFLHHARLLGEDPKTLQELWRRILTTFYALYTADAMADADAEEAAALREAIEETVRNMVSVFGVTVADPECRTIIDQMPLFWTSTKDMLRVYDCREQLVAFINSLEGV